MSKFPFPISKGNYEEPVDCACGCGKLILPFRIKNMRAFFIRYFKGHNKSRLGQKNPPLSEEQRRKASWRTKGKRNPMWGRFGKLAPGFGKRGPLHHAFGKPGPNSGKFGPRSSMWGKKHKKSTILLMRLAQKGNLKKCSGKPNFIETLLAELIFALNLPFKYVGDYSFFIDTLNPDFIRTDQRKEIIELFGCFWHSCPNCKKPKPEESGIKIGHRRDRFRVFRKCGYRSHLIWQHEFLNIEKLIRRLIEIGGK